MGVRHLHHVQRVGDGADGGAKDGAGEEAGDEEDGDLALVKLVLLVERVDVRALQPVAGCGAPQRSVALVRARVGPGPGHGWWGTHHEQEDGQVQPLESLEGGGAVGGAFRRLALRVARSCRGRDRLALPAALQVAQQRADRAQHAERHHEDHSRGLLGLGTQRGDEVKGKDEGWALSGRARVENGIPRVE